MKYSKIFLLSLFFYSCQPTAETSSIKDDRSVQQLSLIKHLTTSDSLYNSEYNEIKKSELFDTEKEKLNSFILDSLKGSFHKWPVTIYKMNVNDWPSKYIDVTFMIPLSKVLDAKNPQDYALIIHAAVPFDQVSVKDSLASVYPGDKVWISGNFSKRDTDQIDMSSSPPEYLFNNPEIQADITRVSSKADK
ncbi:hypothetical protein MTO98_09945 [Mucilaginibacter sp. SMC90]|uniref:hypothetical protein n=1 Tax=Mucilaginibacter sp. SMC90 TaxID=2929803 RepID=UPI001FB2634A|nr:hypothetical protein [Mucilaginibacter sp. SMC90]UOE51397.1 hypothetical protein MTO98_09945 [Mucilaginibacter sp. SMC90]